MGTVRLVSPIAKPMADEKLAKKILKAVKKAAKVKALKRGVKEVVKAVRKGSKGTCIIAGDVSPIDVLSHVPVLCEDNEVPYVFVPSKEVSRVESERRGRFGGRGLIVRKRAREKARIFRRRRRRRLPDTQNIVPGILPFPRRSSARLA